MSLGVFSAEAPRGYGCVPVEMLEEIEAPVVEGDLEGLRGENRSRLNTQSLDLKQSIDRLPDIPASLRWPEGLRQAYETRESDPKGFDPHQPGAKLDAGKVRMGLVMRGFARALFEVGRVGTYGAGKYTPNGWLEVENGEERYMDAAYRHLAEDELNPFDTSAALFHLAQAAWNLLAVLELRLRALER
mgnify:FL=1